MKTHILLITGIVVLLGFLFPSQTHATQAWCDTDWSNRKKITVSNTNVDSDLTDFPLLINITDSNLSSVANSDALDIFFTEETTCTKLKWEKESYTSGTGALVAWVKVPTVDADANTTLYMYYGNSGATDQTNATSTWDDNYIGVWHLDETPNASSTDSTQNSNDGQPENLESGDQTAGNSGGSLDFDGSDEYVQTTSNELKTVDAFTMFVWFKQAIAHGIGTASGILVWEGQSGGNGGGQEEEAHLTMGRATGEVMGSGNNPVEFFIEGSNGDIIIQYGPMTDTSEWHLLIGTVFGLDGSTPSAELFLDGVSVGTDTSDTIPRSNWNIDLRIGSAGASARLFQGIIDEVRISDIARTAAWIKFSYHSQKITAGTITLASQEAPLASGNIYQPPFYFTPNSNKVKDITPNSALVTWNTSIPTDTQLNWSSSLQELLDQSSFYDYELKKSHSVSLSNLTPNTTYYYVIHAKAPTRGNIATGPWSFTTLSAPEDTASFDETTDTNNEERLLEELKEQVKDLQLQVIQLMRQLVSMLLGGL